MSAFLNQRISTRPSEVIYLGFCQNEDVLQEAQYRTSVPYTYEGRTQDADILWTRSNFSALFSDSNRVSAEDYMSQRWEWYWPPTGCHVRKTITGVVRDAYGNGVSGATVYLFNTATGLLVDTQTSAGDGSYTTSDPNAVACIEIGYLAGSPNTAGVTVNTVTGT